MTQGVITIDGPAASGKSTVAKRIAQALGCVFLDTGAMYRAVTLACMNAGIDLQKSEAVIGVMDSHAFEFDRTHVSINGQDVSEAIRGPRVTDHVKFIAGAPAIRGRLVDLQRAFAQTHPTFVTEGRDQGTVAFPEAQVKIFLTADPVERAKRRLAELKAKGLAQDLAQLTQAVIDRDRGDEQRETGPLKAAHDARRIDTTGLTLDEVVQVILDHVREICPTLIPSEAS
ncbi:MAG: (d)CMP kinase [Planctomycetes bacterium]|nr:(d)CMP kinase [Planctomycetota bacterium]